MLAEDGCSIYAHRPRACRTYDCRVFPAERGAHRTSRSSPSGRDDGCSAIATTRRGPSTTRSAPPLASSATTPRCCPAPRPSRARSGRCWPSSCTTCSSRRTAGTEPRRGAGGARTAAARLRRRLWRRRCRRLSPQRRHPHGDLGGQHAVDGVARAVRERHVPVAGDGTGGDRGARGPALGAPRGEGDGSGRVDVQAVSVGQEGEQRNERPVISAVGAWTVKSPRRHTSCAKPWLPPRGVGHDRPGEAAGAALPHAAEPVDEEVVGHVRPSLGRTRLDTGTRSGGGRARHPGRSCSAWRRGGRAGSGRPPGTAALGERGRRPTTSAGWIRSRPTSTGGAQPIVVRSDAATSPAAVPTSSCRRVRRHGRVGVRRRAESSPPSLSTAPPVQSHTVPGSRRPAGRRRMAPPCSLRHASFTGGSRAVSRRPNGVPPRDGTRRPGRAHQP